MRAKLVPGPARPPLVLVVWDDAQSSGIAPVSADDVPHRPSVMQTVGWVLRDDPAGISVANERCMDVGEEYYRGNTFILRVLIKSVTPLNVSRPRTRRVPPCVESSPQSS
jgi:hypothetical protein